MGSCTRRHFLLSICILQLLFIIERQVFDFLGYMWAPILVNFFQILFVIFGFFGAYQYRPRYLVAYTVWSLLWLGWNIFLICFYLNIGILDRDSDLLNLGTGSVSWFEENGYGCRPSYPTNVTSEDPYRPVRPEKVEGCLLDYYIVEVVHAGVHCALAFFGIIGAICLGQTFLDEDDSFDFMGGDAKSPQHTAVHPMYVSYSSLPTTNSANSTQLKQASSSAKLLLLTANGTIVDAGGGGGGGGVGVGGVGPPIKEPQCPPSLPNGPRGLAGMHNMGAVGGSSLGEVLAKAKLSGQHGPVVTTTVVTSNSHSPSNTNTLLSSSSSPSSTFTSLINSSPQSLHHHTHTNSHAQHNNGSLNSSGGSRVILLQHQDSTESSPPTPPARGLSRNASFSKATATSQQHHHHALNNSNLQHPLRKNSSSVSILRYADVVHGQRPPDAGNDDDTFFIPRSASSYQQRSNNFGISNPFNSVLGRPGQYQHQHPHQPGEEAVVGRRQQQLSGSAQQLGNHQHQQSAIGSSQQKRNSLVGVMGAGPSPTGAMSWSGRGSPVAQVHPQVPPLPQHYQPGASTNGTNANAYVTRSPNLNRIARRHNGAGPNPTSNSNTNTNTNNNNTNNNNYNNNNNNNNSIDSPSGSFPGQQPASRSGSSGRLPSTATQCDQIREFPGTAAVAASALVGNGKALPGYYAAALPSSPPSENNNFPPGCYPPLQHQPLSVMVMHRAKSQDRLAYRSRRGSARGGGAGTNGGSHHHHHHHHHHQQQRPRSFCSNNGAYPDYVILEHPGN
uniref:Sodium/potassium-transporting ATPase subunit beta-1-interacting protein n=1 Tax=Anopheles atroparvus TaxID=41427 RepID=A0AAG5CZY8_ANOAO